jgi:desulfoferrodoxin (superoxide reductase-like protein)
MCPVCEETGTFHAIEEEVHYIEDVENLDNLESDHLPQVFTQNGKIHVVVGEEPHPMGDSHRIGSIGLYDEY